MVHKVVAYVVLILVALFAVAQQAYYWPNLPDQVASHFGANGEPDGFMAKRSFVILMLALNLGMPLFLVAIGGTLRFFPNSMINIPHKDYWLHPDRRDATLSDTHLVLIWIGVATGVFLLGLSHLTYLANLQGGPLSMPMFLGLMGVYMALVIGIGIRSYIRYGKPAETVVD